MINNINSNNTNGQMRPAQETRRPLGIYIHIPFCISRCRYCGFYSQAVGKDADAAQKEAAYVDRLITEILGRGAELSDHYTVDTVFIGGGTPSILPAEYISRLIASVEEAFCLEKGTEITMESNPGTLSEGKLRALRQAGVNRVSIGLQSFDNQILKSMGRIHTAEEFLKSYEMARNAGFTNVNIDLMFDFPGQTMAQWEDTLKKAVSLRPEHLSFYGLQIEEGTPLYEDYKMERIPELDEKKDEEMYFLALDLLKEAGYHHYEISNAALPGYECRHNLKYWRFQDYLGIGASASSFLDGVRTTEYPGSEQHVNTFLENCGEYVFTALRTDEGVSLEKFRKQFGRPLWDVFSDRREEFEEYRSQGLVREEAGRIVLTRDGIPVSNEIMALFV
ncbi:MAG: radical SAM family heme chaperone HemW [Eubacterium sp.]